MIRTGSQSLLWAGLVLLILGLLPVACVLLTSLIANAAGCEVTEAGATPCMILGADWGGLLYTLGMMGWFMLISLPVACIGAALLLMGLIGRLFRR